MHVRVCMCSKLHACIFIYIQGATIFTNLRTLAQPRRWFKMRKVFLPHTVCVYIYIYIYTYMHLDRHTHINTHMCVFVCVYESVCMSV